MRQPSFILPFINRLRIGCSRTYFLANGITTHVTGKDIGQHIEGAVNKYYNDGVRAAEQRKFNAAMGY